ncbi:Dipeptide transport system permease protein (plasmid) [Ketogulonicigenium vulgare Y25]|uniref:Dipeptide transport system permease protein n=1 Tax=Ketogulonicigenium vulgare (strain WSH-001) TaxID=759362 RepID=F9YBF0_KETVW|nr:ABC transporter permease [Ketogulonicigenium vulgare]ADO44265.1 Dipeptide transport system permease protein [Ketogulonicigenium vulgare Y25]AEM42702.1 Dipeptide transport system permease protein [Ketogulonicigenium vulgare WSH-001]ALJ82848.1 peptide ABC transporter [Ketogulonicigenium vulgare]
MQNAYISRLVSALVALLGVSIVIFSIARIMPGDPARIALGPNATAAQVEAMREARHLNDPLPMQYIEYVKSVAQGDLGHSLYTNRPVTTDIAQFLPPTLELILISALLMVLLGLPLGVISARYQGKWPDNAGRILSLIAICTPAFVWGVVLQLSLGYIWPVFPLEGQIATSMRPAVVTGFMLIDTWIAGDPRAFLNALYHMVLPALALALSGIGQCARLTRSNMIETYQRPYTEMVRAYGVKPGRIAWRYAFRPAFIPTLTILGLEFAALLGNAFLVEKVFGWPGLSRYGVEVILRKDLDAIVGTVLIIAAAFLIMNILVDLLVTLVNPRIRLSPRRA